MDAAGRGELAVSQKATGRLPMRQGRCEWAVQLGNALPLDLEARFGAGKADLTLQGGIGKIGMV